MWTEPDEHDVEECWKMIEQEYQDWIEEGYYMKKYSWKVIIKDHNEAMLEAERFAETTHDMEVVDMEELLRDRSGQEVFGVCEEDINGERYYMPDWCILRNFAGRTSFHKNVEDAHRHFQETALVNLESINYFAPKNSDLKKWSKRFINRLSSDIGHGRMIDETTWNKYTYLEK